MDYTALPRETHRSDYRQRQTGQVGRQKKQ
nr:MAG TPA: hypothetical protein [Caudoviricetes sp.]